MPDQLLEAEATAAPVEVGLASDATREQQQLTQRRVRAELRRQIALLERRLAEVFAAAFPRQGIEWRVGAAGGPRVLDVAELERVRDALAARLRTAEIELVRRGRIEERNRALLEEMIAAPELHRGLTISAADIGEPSCRTWRSVPRLGLVGMLMGWWRVKISSGCPLATGAGGVLLEADSIPPPARLAAPAARPGVSRQPRGWLRRLLPPPRRLGSVSRGSSFSKAPAPTAGAARAGPGGGHARQRHG